MKLFIPGPIWCREDALREMSKQPMGHRSKQFTALYSGLLEKLKKVLETKCDVHVSTSSGSGIWELAARNCVRKRALVCECGAFSQKWGDVTEMNGREVVRLTVPSGKAVRGDMIADALKKNDVDAVLYVHNETSTGVTNPIKEAAEVLKDKPDVLFLVDAVSSLTGMPIDIDGLGIDICLASTQKAIGIPPGAAVFTASARAYERAKTIKDRGYYFDLLGFQKSAQKGQTTVTPTLPHIYALDFQCDNMLAEGMQKRYARHTEMANFVRAWAKKHFDTFAEKGYESDTLTCITNTRNIDVSALNKELLAKHDCIISDGYGDLKGKTFRIAHMGDMQMADMRELLGWIDGILGL